MRISNRMLYDQLVQDINSNTEKLFRLNSQISSGKRIDRPSEDPVGMSSVLIYRTELNSFDQYKKSIDQSRGWLARTESIIQDVDDILARAVELATQQASATASADTREGAAEEIQQLREQVTGLANSKYGNKYMFGGTRTQTIPFAQVDVENWQDNVDQIAAAAPGGPADGDRYLNSTDGHIYQYDGGATAWVDQGAPTDGMTVYVDNLNEFYVYSSDDSSWDPHYRGNDSTYTTRISKTDQVETNLPGDQLFTNSMGNVFETLMNLEKALRDNDQEGIQSQLSELEDASVVLNNNMASIGARINRLDTTKQLTERAVADTEARRSLIEDLDYTKAITELQNQQTIYQASLQSAAMITSLSLVDYI